MKLLSKSKVIRIFAIMAVAVIVAIVLASRFAPVLDPEYATDEAIITDHAASSLKGANAAASVFLDKFESLPGDMPDPERKIPVCAKQNCGAGNGNFMIGETASTVHTFSGEATYFGTQLAAADFFTEAKAISGSHIFPVYHDGKTPLPFSYTSAANPEGHYLILSKGDGINEDSYFLPPQWAQKIDSALDDGLPASGKVVAAGKKECVTTSEDQKIIYNTAYNDPCMFLYMRMDIPVKTGKSETEN